MKQIVLTNVGMAVLGGLVMALGAEAQGAQGNNEPVASLAQVQGTVMVNHGKDYVAARSGTPLRPGARVLTMDKSSASVVYKDSCIKQLKENGLMVVRGPSDCESTGAVKAVGPYYAAAIGSETKSDAGSGAEGTWNATTNTPTLVSGVGKKEECWKVGVAGSTLLDGTSQWGKGDSFFFDGAKWKKGECGAAGYVAADGPGLGALAAGVAIFGGGAVYIYNAGRNDRAVSPQ